MFVFSKENAVGLVRTFMPGVYSWLVFQLNGFDWLVDLLPDVPTETWIVLIGGLIYQIIRAAAEKFPSVGYLLIFNTKPSYEGT